MKEKRICSILFFVAAALDYLAAIIYFVGEPPYYLAAIWLCCGSVFLCLGFLYWKKAKEGEEDNKKNEPKVKN